jgi:hypothetical protein
VFYGRAGDIRLVYSEIGGEAGSGLVGSDLRLGSRFVVVEVQLAGNGNSERLKQRQGSEMHRCDTRHVTFLLTY